MRRYKKLTAFLLALSLAACSFLQPAVSFAAEGKTERAAREVEDAGSWDEGASQVIGAAGQEETKQDGANQNDMKQDNVKQESTGQGEAGAESAGQGTGQDGAKTGQEADTPNQAGVGTDSDNGNRDTESRGTARTSGNGTGTENATGNEAGTEPGAGESAETLPAPATEGEDNLDPGEDTGFAGTPGELETYGPGLASSMATLGLRLLGRARGWDPGSLGLTGTVYARAYNEGGSTLEDAFGFKKSDLLAWMHEQATTGYYLGTVYDGGDNRNPNGDASYNGRDVRPGQIGLNCTGFVWHMLMKAGARVTGESDGRNTDFVGNTDALLAAGANVDNSGANPTVPGESGWVAFLSGSNVEYKTYVSDSWEDMVKVLVADDYWDAGDVIWTWDLKNPLVSGSGGNNGKFPNADVAQRLFFTEGMYGHPASGLSWGNSSHNHILLYCGTDFARYCDSATNNYAQYVSGVSDQLVWHSSDVHFNYQTWQPDGSTPWNQITSIFPKENGGPYAVTIVKTGGPTGSLNLKKTSSNRTLTDGNSCYSLEGATYLVFRSEADAANGAANLAVATLVTDGDGNSNTVEMEPGTYYVKETKASKGYALDRTIHQVTVESGQTATVQSVEIPQSDPVSIILGKVDAETNANKPQGSASLGGAEFTVKYYNGLYDTDPAAQGQTSARTWVLRTEADGYCRLGERYKVSGDDFYKLDGVVTLPLGTITIQESKAPTGYLINNEVFVRKITSVGHAEQVSTYNQPIIPETPQKLRIRLKKVDAETGKGEAQGTGTLSGAVYGVYDASGTKVDELTTDAKGEAVSKELPLGNYTVKETKAPNGYLIDGTTHKVDGAVPKDTTTRVFEYGVTSGEVPQKVKINLKKVDAETGKGEPQGTATLAGAVYGVYDATGARVDELTTDARGEASSRELPLGNYTVKETKASNGYLIDGTTHKVDGAVPKDTTTRVFEYGVTSGEVPQKVKINLKKVDAETGKGEPQGTATLAGAVYGVYDATGARVDELTTDAKGEAVSKELPLGNYTVKETRASNGYLVDQAAHAVNGAKPKDTTTRVFEYKVGSGEDVIRGDVEIVKFIENLDADDDTIQGLAGIEFTFTSKTTGEKVLVIRTDKNGFATTASKENPRGTLVFDTYRVEETKHPENVKAIKPFDVTVSEEGVTLKGIYKEDKLIVSPVTVVKKDKSSGKTIPAANVTFRLLDENKEPVTMTTRYPDKVVHETFKTNDDGQFTFPDVLTYGTYYLEELDAPEGYLKGELLEFKVTEGSTWEEPLIVEYADENAMGRIRVTKTDSETGEPVGGATFEIVAAEDVVTPEGTTRVEKGGVAGTMTTGKDGKAESDDLFLGKYVVRETRQPDGFVLDGTEHGVELSYAGQDVPVVYESVKAENKPTRLFIFKMDGETKEPLAGVEFEIWNKDMWPDGTGNGDGADGDEGTDEADADDDGAVDPGMAVSPRFVTDGNGRVEVSYLAPGTYLVREVETLPGYVLDETVHEFTVDEDGLIDGKDVGIRVIENTRTKLIGTTAVSADTGTHEGVPGEEVTIIDTVAFEDLQPGEEYTVRGRLMDARTGEPFLAGGEEVTAETKFVPKEGSGSVDVVFTFDGRELLDKKIVVFEKAYVRGVEILSHEDTGDEDQTVEFPRPEIGTTAADAETGSHEAVAAGEVTIVDTVKYEGLVTDHEYTVKGTLMDKATGEKLLVDGKEVTSEAKFVPEEKDGSVDITFTFDASGLAGHKVVAFESVSVKGVEVAVHADIEDGDQTVEFPEPEIRTTATDVETGSHEAVAAGEVTIVDTVKYEGLVTDHEYTVKGTLMDKATGEKLLVDGKEVTSEAKFVPEEKDGSVDITFTFDASGLAGHKVVAFESVSVKGVEVAVHADIEDDGQTVRFPEPEIGTTAVNAETGTHEAAATREVTIVDTVRYENLVTGHEYTVKGVLMDKATGEKLLVDGKEVTSEARFTPEEKDGGVDVTFTFDARGLEGTKVVAFESLHVKGVEVAVHADIEDEDQTVEFPEPEIGTTAVNAETGTHEAAATKEVAIVDTVKYKNLVVGHEYTVKGTLMDKSTGEKLLVDGKEVTSEARFTPEEKDGSVDVTFTFDARGLEGTKVVAFESLHVKDVEVAVHADIEEDDQTVEFPEPEIGTTAVDKETKTHEAVAARKVTIVDTVAYKNLVVGQEYTVKGVLMDKATGRELFVGGRKVTSEASFTPKEKDGSVTVEFTFDARGLAGHKVVAFESLYVKDDEVAVHTDIEDDGQTVEIKEPEKPPVPKTGDEGNALPFAAALMAGSLAALAGGAYAWKRGRKGGKPGNPETENTPDGKNDKDGAAGENGAGGTK